MNISELKLEDLPKLNIPADDTTVSEYNADYANGTYRVVSKLAYLLGVEKRYFENEHGTLEMEWYNSLKSDKNARIARNLSVL